MNVRETLRTGQFPHDSPTVFHGCSHTPLPHTVAGRPAPLLADGLIVGVALDERDFDDVRDSDGDFDDVLELEADFEEPTPSQRPNPSRQPDLQ